MKIKQFKKDQRRKRKKHAVWVVVRDRNKFRNFFYDVESSEGGGDLIYDRIL